MNKIIYGIILLCVIFVSISVKAKMEAMAYIPKRQNECNTRRDESGVY